MTYSLGVMAREPVGLSIQYSSIDGNELDKLHAKSKLKLTYRSQLQKVDDLVPANFEAFDSLDLENKKQILTAVCASYLQDSRIEKCQLNFPLKMHTAASCSIQSDLLNNSSITQVSQVFTDCSPFPDQSFHSDSPTQAARFGKLTRFWSQEAIGAPEVQEFLADLDTVRSLPPFDLPEITPTTVGIIDGGFDPISMPLNASTQSLRQCLENWEQDRETQDCGVNEANGRHGTAVSHLISGAPPIGVGAKSQLSILATADAMSFTRASDQILAAAPIPAIVNMSMGLPDGDIVRSSFERVAQETVLVASAGNTFPDSIDQNLIHASQVGAILVGSTDPTGFPSQFSQEDSEVVISAPSDVDIQQSIGPGGEEITFGGTSGAAPLVTGALANVMALLPGITPQELKILLKQTAIPTFTSSEANNGKGVLNAYQLVRVAHRLMGRWPKNRRELENQNSSNFDFSDEAQRLLNESQPLLANFTDCENRKNALKKLRKAFFLAPNSTTIRQRLSEIYRGLGYESQANFYAPINSGEITRQQKRVNRNFLRAIKDGNLNEVKKWVSAGADLQTWGGSEGANRDNRPIQIAARTIQDPEAQREMILYLHSQGSLIHPAATTLIGVPPVHPITWAAQKNFPELVPSMLAQTPALASESGILSSISDKGQASILRALLESGANVEDPDRFSSMSPLMKAVLSGDADSTRVLLEFGANRNVVFQSDNLQFTLQDFAESIDDEQKRREVLQALSL